MSRTLSRAKVGQTSRISRFGLVSSPRSLILTKLCQTDACIRSLIFAVGLILRLAPATLSKLHHRLSMLDGLVSHFVTRLDAHAFQQRRVFLRACRMNRCSKRIWDRIQRPVDTNRINREKNAFRYDLPMSMQESLRSSVQVPIPSKQARVPWPHWLRPIACEGHT